jgi:uncharacterized protein (TIGR00369 family)
MGDELSVEDFLAQMPYGMGGLNEKMGIELVEVSPERVVATMPVEGNTQPYGLLHGGASVVLAETLGSVGSALHAAPDRLSVGIEINATHHRSATSGTVTGTATAIHLGRTTARASGCAPAGSPARWCRGSGTRSGGVLLGQS